MRWIYLVAGLICVGLGIAGTILPVMPGVLFFIIAAVCFARSNPVWEARIMNHPKIGPPVRAFRERGVIAPAGKFAAVTGMALGSVAGWFLIHHTIWRYAPAALCLVCAAYVLTRPSR
ncbi:hypothetical protein ABI_38330 [Asticcacaulis biprosthecium C19]|uniref:Inner membrane protein ybaN n=1 Tax=Asticcacaulis biprosthecium C19 TaxID=715226 RepID=F4QRG2_9CAUL|nr:YbaN family protein [Asticcacaulis biprosthecium]EGF90799.1 hypothetical protein ABI_38330 [Asticcacaulis biprosthecium C19]